MADTDGVAMYGDHCWSFVGLSLSVCRERWVLCVTYIWGIWYDGHL